MVFLFIYLILRNFHFYCNILKFISFLLVAFAVDPLYHRTSSLFDEGGAKGLLLTNLGINGGFCVLFDSFEVPGKVKSYSNHIDASDKIDLSFTKGMWLWHYLEKSSCFICCKSYAFLPISFVINPSFHFFFCVYWLFYI